MDLSKIAPGWLKSVRAAIDDKSKVAIDVLIVLFATSIVSTLISQSTRWPAAIVFVCVSLLVGAALLLQHLRRPSTTSAAAKTNSFGFGRATALALLAFYIGLHFGWSNPALLTRMRGCQIVAPWEIKSSPIAHATTCANTFTLFQPLYAHRVNQNKTRLIEEAEIAWKKAMSTGSGYDRTALKAALAAINEDPNSYDPSSNAGPNSSAERLALVNARLNVIAQFQDHRPFYDVTKDGKQCKFCPELTLILPGQVKLGSPIGEEGRDDDEGGRDGSEDKVENPFAIGTYEVSRAEWHQCYLLGGDCRKLDKNELDDQQLPITNVSLDQVTNYIYFLSRETGQRYRLPYEIEWEYAARASSKGRFGFNSLTGSELANVCLFANGLNSETKLAGQNRACSDGYPRLAPVSPTSRQLGTAGYFGPNSWGIYHTLGNAEEWVNEQFSATPDGVHSGRQNASNACKGFVTRGGSYLSSAVAGAENNNRSLIGLRIAMRTCTGSAKGWVGFRVVREVDAH